MAHPWDFLTLWTVSVAIYISCVTILIELKRHRSVQWGCHVALLLRNRIWNRSLLSLLLRSESHIVQRDCLGFKLASLSYITLRLSTVRYVILQIPLCYFIKFCYGTMIASISRFACVLVCTCVRTVHVIMALWMYLHEFALWCFHPFDL